jgi:murein DD-endopeptidase MepM/ murein hydrolase activator NlpD
MTARIIRSALVLALSISVTDATAAAKMDQRSARDAARTYTDWFYGGAIERLWERFSPALRLHLGSAEGLRAFRRQIATQAGRETEMIEERVVPWLGAVIYSRVARFSRASTPISVQWTLGDKGVVHAFFVRPAQAPGQSRFLDYQTKTRLRLPFDGTWWVFWGGRSVFENNHALTRDQRFAYDFVVVQDDRTLKGTPFRNESYFCFGRRVLAPGDGKVVATAADFADNRPPKMNEERPLGNHVIIDHGTGEYSFLAHLQEGSVRVTPGQTVTAGEELGRCGNSGRSSEPHLHYHLQTTPLPGDGDGLPAQFMGYEIGGQPITRGEPSRGQTIAPR